MITQGMISQAIVAYCLSEEALLADPEIAQVMDATAQKLFDHLSARRRADDPTATAAIDYFMRLTAILP